MYRQQLQWDGIKEESRVQLRAQNRARGLAFREKGGWGVLQDVGVSQETTTGRIC